MNFGGRQPQTVDLNGAQALINTVIRKQEEDRIMAEVLWAGRHHLADGAR